MFYVFWISVAHQICELQISSPVAYVAFSFCGRFPLLCRSFLVGRSLFHCSVCLVLSQDHTVVKSEASSSLLVKIAFATIHCLSWFHTDFRTVCSFVLKDAIGVFRACLEPMDCIWWYAYLAILTLPVHAHGTYFHLCPQLFSSMTYSSVY